MTIKSFFADLWESMLDGSTKRLAGPDLSMYERNLWRLTYERALEKELNRYPSTDAVVRATDAAYVAVLSYKTGRLS